MTAAGSPPWRLAAFADAGAVLIPDLLSLHCAGPAGGQSPGRAAQQELHGYVKAASWRPGHAAAPAIVGRMLTRAASLLHIDFAPRHRQPSWHLVLVAALTAIAGSLAADALLVVIGQAVFPSTRGYMHFQFFDYGRLTVVGVIIACIGWPVVTRVSSQPRWLFVRSAILVTLVLWLPDLYILYRGEPGDAVGVLMLMHIAIAVVTYNCLVRIAPVRPLPVPRFRARLATSRPSMRGAGRHASPSHSHRG